MTLQRTNESKRREWHFSPESSCDLESHLLGDIRALLSDKSESPPQSSMLVLLDRLIQILQVLLGLSPKNGYMSVILEKRPSWSRQIDAMYQANLDCVSSLKLVRACFENDRSDVALVQALELKLKNWIESFSAMRRLESTMLQEAVLVDFGGEA